MEISLAPEVLFNIGSFPVTNSFLWSVVLSLFLMSLTLFVRARLKKVPGTLQNIFELVMDGAYGFARNVIGSDKKAKKVFPLVFTLFVFTLFANLATYIPGQSAVSLKTASGAVPLFRAVIADYGLVFVMTLISILTTQVIAIIVHGPFGYIGKYINLGSLKDFFGELANGRLKLSLLGQGFLDFFLGLMDVVGEIAKIISLSFRLFGNMFAGEVLSAVMLFLFPFFAPLPFMFLGLLTAVVQAFVFSVLTLIFITMASEVEESRTVEEATI